MVFIILICGYAGCGKSTFGKELSKRLGYTFIDKDTVCKRFIDLYSKDRDNSYYSEVLRPLEYQILVDIINENFCLGNKKLVVVAPFIKEMKTINWISNNLLDIPLVLNLICSEEEMFENISLRNSEFDKSKLLNWNSYLNDINYDYCWDNIYNINYSKLNFDFHLSEVLNLINLREGFRGE